MVTESDPIVAETAARIFADLADPQTINRAGDARWKDPLWHALAEAGLTLAWVPEELGGAAASLAEGFAILGAAGRYGLPVPLAETMLAGWLLARAGIDAPAGAMTVASCLAPNAGRSILLARHPLWRSVPPEGGLAGTLPTNLTTFGSLEGALAKVSSTPSITGSRVT